MPIQLAGIIKLLIKKKYLFKENENENFPRILL